MSYLAIERDGTLMVRAFGAEASYYYAAGQRVAIRRGAVVYYLHTDHGHLRWLGFNQPDDEQQRPRGTGSRARFYENADKAYKRR